jgi:glyoxylase-like metal-dependent hydrolase (beta-lactamase superfamily II)
MYTGHVVVGGPADVHELPALIITKVAVGPMANNAYLLRDRDSGQQLLIDAAAEPDRLIRLIGDGGLQTVVTTHAHQDHWQALAEVVAATGAVTVANPLDSSEIPVPTNVAVTDGSTIQVGGCTLCVIHLRGHTPGSIALLYEDPQGHPHLFTGDSLFPGGVGKTWSDADFEQLHTDVSQKLFDVLPDDTWVYPGHGSDTTLGAERPNLAEWYERRW